MVRPLSVEDSWRGVTRSATLVRPATSRSRAGSGCATTRAEAGGSNGNAVAGGAVPAPRPQAARTSTLIALPAMTRFILSPPVSTYPALNCVPPCPFLVRTKQMCGIRAEMAQGDLFRVLLRDRGRLVLPAAIRKRLPRQ